MMKVNKIAVYLFFIMATSLILASCATSGKGCGCGADINRVNKPAKRFH